MEYGIVGVVAAKHIGSRVALEQQGDDGGLATHDGSMQRRVAKLVYRHGERLATGEEEGHHLMSTPLGSPVLSCHTINMWLPRTENVCEGERVTNQWRSVEAVARVDGGLSL